jgi:rod shape determining protein RodA
MNNIGLRRQFKAFDFVLTVMIFVLAVSGIIMLASATRIDINGIDGLFKRQIMWIGTGFVLMLAAAFIDYHFICKFYIPIYILTVGLLVAIFSAKAITGTNRWFGIGEQSIQPSEFAKVFMIIFLSKFIDKKGDGVNKMSVILLLLLLVMLPVGLVYLQPALSASGVILVISCAVIFAGKIQYRKIAVILLFIAPIVTYLYADFISDDRAFINKLVELNIVREYQIERIEAMIDPTLDPDTYRQLEDSKYAIGSGQLRGKGMYNGIHGHSTAESENDFIFAVLGEEFGFIGCASVIILMFLIVCKCLYTAATAPDTCGRLIAVGAAAMFFFQSFFHVGVTIGLMPVTGVTFPFFSYGGSSMWACMIAAGLVINVGMSKNKSLFED